jgi:lysophospholipid acyltransferase (LPLAT)-like uncharacterized protein
LKPVPVERRAPHLTFRDRLQASAASCLGWVILQAIGRTSRLSFHPSPGVQKLLAERKPFIYALWHRFQLLLIFAHRGQGLHVLVSQSRDGEYIAKTMRRLGYGTIRGSSSRGGAAAFMEIVRRLQAGERVVFTPDGPRGPFRSIQPGLAAAARQAGVPVVPVGWAGSRVKELNSWDRFLVPLPFGRYHVVYGEPVFLGDDESAAEESLRRALDAAVVEAEKHLALKK